MSTLFWSGRFLPVADVNSAIEALSEEERAAVKTVWLDGNKLESAPEKLTLLSSVEVLELESNGINSIDNLRGMGSLKKLYLGYNDLTAIPRWIGELTSLEVLWLNKNELTSLPATLCRLTNLQS